MDQVRTRPWDLEPGPKEKLMGAVTTKQCFRMITQAMGTGSPAGNAARRDPVQWSRGWAWCCLKSRMEGVHGPFQERVIIKLGDSPFQEIVIIKLVREN